MNAEMKIGIFVFIAILVSYFYSAYILGAIEAISTLGGCVITLLSGYLFHKRKTYLRIIAVILNIYLIFLFFLPKAIKQKITSLKEREANEII